MVDLKIRAGAGVRSRAGTGAWVGDGAAITIGFVSTGVSKYSSYFIFCVLESV